MPQISNSDVISMDSRLSDSFSVPKLSPGIESSNDNSPFPISFHPHFAAASSSTLLYGSWIGTSAEHKNGPQIFGLQGIFSRDASDDLRYFLCEHDDFNLEKIIKELAHKRCAKLFENWTKDRSEFSGDIFRRSTRSKH